MTSLDADHDGQISFEEFQSGFKVCVCECMLREGDRVIQWNPSNTDTLGTLRCVLNREVSSFQGVNNTYLYGVGT